MYNITFCRFTVLCEFYSFRKFLGIFLLIPIYISAQLGTEHYISPIHVEKDSEIKGQYIYLSTPFSNVHVAITDGAGNVISNETVSNGSPVEYYLGNGTSTKMFVTQSDLSQPVSDKGLILTGDKGFYVSYRGWANLQAVYIVSKSNASLGKEFRTGGIPFIADNNTYNTFSSIMATQDNTTVNITDFDPNVIFKGPSGDITNNSFSFTLNRGETYTLVASATTLENRNGLIGAKITSNKNISVVSGNALGGFSATKKDYALDQIIPRNKTGDEYIVVRGNGGTESEKVLVVANSNNTKVYINGAATPITTLNAGDYFLIPTSYYQGIAGQENMYIKTSKDAYIYQYITGVLDKPATVDMLFIPPLNCLSQKFVDEIPKLEKIGSKVYDTDLFLIAKKHEGSLPVVTMNGTPISTSSFNTVAGNTEWVTYKVNNQFGDKSIYSEEAISIGVLGFSGSAGIGGYYSGFGVIPDNLSFTACNNQVTNIVEGLEQNLGTEIPGGGTWTPAFSSGTDIFNPSVDTPRVYHYFYENGCEQVSFYLDIQIIAAPTAPIMSDITQCTSYTLPTLSDGNYYTESGGKGTLLNTGDVVTTTKTIYIYKTNGTCSDESEFVITINPKPEISPIGLIP